MNILCNCTLSVFYCGYVFSAHLAVFLRTKHLLSNEKQVDLLAVPRTMETVWYSSILYFTTLLVQESTAFTEVARTLRIDIYMYIDWMILID